jgi:hypothetical protein
MGKCVGNTGPVDRLGFPSICAQDGPLGIRFADLITAFPAGITTGATWVCCSGCVDWWRHADEIRMRISSTPVHVPWERRPRPREFTFCLVPRLARLDVRHRVDVTGRDSDLTRTSRELRLTMPSRCVSLTLDVFDMFKIQLLIF